jgi:FAD/FMN-containing dehydrogenase
MTKPDTSPDEPGVDDGAREQFIRAVLAVIPEASGSNDLRGRVEALADAVLDAECHFRVSRVYRDEDIHRINASAARVRELDAGFTLSQVDQGAGAVSTFFRNVRNSFARLIGQNEHEGEWDGERWTTWNFEFACVPGCHIAPTPPDSGNAFASVQEVVRSASSLRVVAAGHTFNESTSTGGTREAPQGTLLSLDRYDRWERVPAEEVTRSWGITGEEAERVVRVQAGKRLHDLSAALWDAGLAMPLAGSTDAQSLGGLLATDLHGTGRDHGFLSEQILSVRLVTAEGALVTFDRTQEGWVTDERPPRIFRWLPVAGALGMLGVVVELTLRAERAYYLRKGIRYVSRTDAENDLSTLLGQHHHLSFYYPTGDRGIRTVRMNTWDRTPQTSPWTASFAQLGHEIGDHALLSFAPGMLLDLGKRDARTDPLIKHLNEEEPIVLPAPAAFARRLYYLHDELEYGIPIAEFRACAAAVMDLLEREVFQAILEMRFTPDASAALLGPGTAGRDKGGTAFIELATSFGQHSPLRIAAVHQEVHEVLRAFGGRPHLGKKTAIDAACMASIYGADWAAFQELRRAWDPRNKLLPPDNHFLNKIFAG